jgi:glyoxylase-like metal-dependent hydrolase (beta-lactamase superfamily II)
MSFKSNRAASFRIAIPMLFLAAAMPALAQTLRQVTKLADGVYSIEHRDNSDGFKSGNTTVIIGDRQVFVVDACFLPSAAREDIAEIRKWTDKPVSFLINTHFHNDHNLANRIYMDNFPALTIIAHTETKRGMDMFGPGSESREEKQNAYFQQLLETGKTKEGRALTAAEKREVKMLWLSAPGDGRAEENQFQSATLTLTTIFPDIGNREVQIKFGPWQHCR